jgi:hypothetical protein
MTQSITVNATFSVIAECCYADCHYAECRYAECRNSQMTPLC